MNLHLGRGTVESPTYPVLTFGNVFPGPGAVSPREVGHRFQALTLNLPLRQMCSLTKSTGFSLHKTWHLRCVSKYLHEPRVSRTVLFRSWGRIADRVGTRWPKSCLCEIPCVTLHSSTAFQKCVETFPGSCHSVLTKPSWVIHECGYLLLRLGTVATQRHLWASESAVPIPWAMHLNGSYRGGQMVRWEEVRTRLWVEMHR